MRVDGHRAAIGGGGAAGSVGSRWPRSGNRPPVRRYLGLARWPTRIGCARKFGVIGDHERLPGSPARARPSGRAQRTGPARRARGSGYWLRHVGVAGGGVLDPIEAVSATMERNGSVTVCDKDTEWQSGAVVRRIWISRGSGRAEWLLVVSTMSRPLRLIPGTGQACPGRRHSRLE